MNKKGVWSLAPAFDMTFSYKKDSIWISEHQMLINGKSGNIINDDFLAVADNAGIKRSDAIQCEEQVREAVSSWSLYAEEADLSKGKVERIQKELKR